MSKWIHCKQCGHQYKNSLDRCPQCFHRTPMTTRRFWTICPIVLLVAAAVILPIIALTTGDNDQPNGDTTGTTATTTTTTSSAPNGEASSSDTDGSTQGTTTTTATYRQPTDKDGNVVIGNDGIARVTLPKWLLFLTEPNFNYQLTEQEKTEYRFTGITKNTDGSATYTIDQNDFHRCRLILTSNANGLVSGLKNLSTVSKVEYTHGVYGTIKVYTTHTTATQLQTDDTLAKAVLSAGLQATVVQYFDIDQNVGSTFQLYGANGTLLATTKFPQTLQQ